MRYIANETGRYLASNQIFSAVGEGPDPRSTVLQNLYPSSSPPLQVRLECVLLFLAQQFLGSLGVDGRQAY